MAKSKKRIASRNQKYTIQDFNAEFPDNDACLIFILESRWPDGRTMCDKCGVERKHYRVTGRTAFACDHCGNHIYPLAGTIFEKTTLAQDLVLCHVPDGFYSLRRERKTDSARDGVTYKTAWRMFKQIRTLMSENISLEGRRWRWTNHTSAEIGAMGSAVVLLEQREKSYRNWCSRARREGSCVSLHRCDARPHCTALQRNTSCLIPSSTRTNIRPTWGWTRSTDISIAASITVLESTSWATCTRTRLKDSGVW